MRFLLDENVHGDLEMILAKLGHDVSTVARTVGDPSILAQAVQEDRVLITNDRDFGELIFRYGHEHRGVLYLRLRSTLPSDIAERISIALKEGHPEDAYIIVEVDTIRVRRS